MVLLCPLDILLVFEGKGLITKFVQPIQEFILIYLFHLQMLFQGGYFVVRLEPLFDLHIHYLLKVVIICCQLVHLGLQ
jgi:hypothetical protein